MKKLRYLLVLVAALALVAAFSVLARGTDDDDRGGLGVGPVKAFEKAFERLGKIEDRDFEFDKNAFERGAPATLTINPHGAIRMTNAKVTAVAEDRVTVEIWKLSFVIHKMPDTQVFAGRVKDLTFSDITVGDALDVLGELDATSAAFVHARVVHDRSQIVRARDEEVTRLRQVLNELINRLIEILNRTGQPIPSGLPSPVPTASPTPSPAPSPSPTPSPTP